MPDLPRVPPGRIATFALPELSSSPSSPSSSDLFNFRPNFDALQGLGPDAMAHVLSTQASVQAALASAPASVRNSAPNARLIAALTQTRADNADNVEELSQQMQLGHLIRACDNTPELRRLLRLILSIENAPNNQRVLQRRLNQLNRILQTRQRSDIHRGVHRGVTYSSQIRTLRCHEPARARTRRSLHAYISRLRDQVMERIRGLQMTRRSLPPAPPHAKGGTKKKMSKQNKTKKI